MKNASAIFFTIVSIVISFTLQAQTNHSDNYLCINYPLNSGPEFKIGDTVVKTIIPNGNNLSQDLTDRYLTIALSSQKHSVYELTGVVTKLHHRQVTGTQNEIIDSVGLRIFSIKCYSGEDTLSLDTLALKNTVVHINDSVWSGISRIRNITGLWRFLLNIDNFRIGDTVQSSYNVRPAMLLDAVGLGNTKTYHIKGIVTHLETSSGNWMNVKIISINEGYNRDMLKMEYNGKIIKPGVNVFSECEEWTKPFQYLQLRLPQKRYWELKHTRYVYNVNNKLLRIDWLMPGGREEELTDDTTKTKFIIDSTRTIISAVDVHGNILWQTNPRRDNNIPPYRSEDREYISEFTIGAEKLGIRYANSQFGSIDKKTGKFFFSGQD